MILNNMRDYFKENVTASLGGMASLIVFMGLGRFAYTPIIPYMQTGAGMSDTLAGAIASSNYLGYLLGTLVFIFFNKMRYILFVISLAAIAVSSAAMGFTSSPLLWHLLRFIAGFGCAAGFILSTAMLFDYLAGRNAVRYMGWHYSGVGTGIAISGVIVPVFGMVGGWEGAWIMTGITAGIISIGAVFWIKSSPEYMSKKNDSIADSTEFKRKKEFWLLSIAYFMEGFGYVIIGTFMVAAAQNYLGESGVSYIGWIVVGIFAAPSTIFWFYVAGKTGFPTALIYAYTVQLAGLILFVSLQNTIAVFITAITFGGTFMGIVSMSVTFGKELWVERSTQAVAILTTFFSVGQIIGPFVAGFLSDVYNSFTYPLLLSCGALLFGLIFLLYLKKAGGNYAVCKY
ncbi:MAG: YbfB/YjiJ family MFS transporter [Flexistipes sinusarabici]|uniref:YbfB/YjiJ family MFS transporter n=1 Tax=Flexistipes sinusarabici TaxID=2352 RepID=A0A5D0MQS3_FLESI|nr:YbfB/YjiJ family MFS transporter [Flexistipes sinusarabici]TYB33788.1 MAG: YbfB/YjiJ family MFS transporter [Flexistipes sinusarabici]